MIIEVKGSAQAIVNASAHGLSLIITKQIHMEKIIGQEFIGERPLYCKHDL